MLTACFAVMASAAGNVVIKNHKFYDEIPPIGIDHPNATGLGWSVNNPLNPLTSANKKAGPLYRNGFAAVSGTTVTKYLDYKNPNGTTRALNGWYLLVNNSNLCTPYPTLTVSDFDVDTANYENLTVELWFLHKDNTHIQGTTDQRMFDIVTDKGTVTIGADKITITDTGFTSVSSWSGKIKKMTASITGLPEGAKITEFKYYPFGKTAVSTTLQFTVCRVVGYGDLKVSHGSSVSLFQRAADWYTFADISDNLNMTTNAAVGWIPRGFIKTPAYVAGTGTSGLAEADHDYTIMYQGSTVTSGQYFTLTYNIKPFDPADYSELKLNINALVNNSGLSDPDGKVSGITATGGNEKDLTDAIVVITTDKKDYEIGVTVSNNGVFKVCSGITPSNASYIRKATADIKSANIPDGEIITGIKVLPYGENAPVNYFRFTGTDITGTAKVRYDITYKPGAHSETGAEYSEKAEHGTDVDIDYYGTFERTGYTQIGWATTDGATSAEYEEYDTYTATADLTLYPVWEVAKYDIVYRPSELATGTTHYDTKTHDVDIDIRGETYTLEGYKQVGWSSNSSSGYAEYKTHDFGEKYTANQPINLWAVWEAVKYNVTLNTNGGTIAAGKNITEYEYDSGLDLPTSADITKTENTFDGWYDNAGLTGTAVEYIPFDATGDVEYWAKWIPNTYTVTLNTNGGTINSGNVTEYTYGTGAALPTDITKTEYNFIGWYDNAELNGNPVTAITATDTGAKQYWAKWSAGGYSVTLNTNGGTINSGNVTEYTYGVGAALPADVTKVGYEFDGWFDNANLDGDPVTAITAAATGAKQYWAGWTASVYDVTLNSNGGAINSGVITEYTYGVGAALPSDVTRHGYNFTGWYDNENLTGTAITDIGTTETGDKEFWAGWTNTDYDVTLNTNGGTIIAGNITGYESGIETVLPTEIEKTGYTFIGWYDNEDLSGDAVTAIGANETGDKEFWAAWQANTYTVIFNANGGIGAMEEQKFTYGEAKALLANGFTRYGFKFSGWSTVPNGMALYLDGETVSNLCADANGIITLYAAWGTANGWGVIAVPIYFGITIEPSENGTVTSSVKSALRGTFVTLNVEPDEGYELDTLSVRDFRYNKLDVSNTTGNKYMFRATFGEITVTATFKKIAD